MAKFLTSPSGLKRGSLALAVAFSLLAALGFSCGYIFMRVGTQRVSPPTATFFNVLTGATLVVCLALALRLSDIKALTPVALGWIALMGAMAYPFARVLISTAIAMIGATRTSPVNSLQPIFVLGLAVAIFRRAAKFLGGRGHADGGLWTDYGFSCQEVSPSPPGMDSTQGSWVICWRWAQPRLSASGTSSAGT